MCKGDILLLAAPFSAFVLSAARLSLEAISVSAGLNLRAVFRGLARPNDDDMKFISRHSGGSNPRILKQSWVSIATRKSTS